ncbi:hypothetical protein ACH5RR_038114 [Cinchona calisaya]|uniref:Uncharacterized protein n=1 Tax=Cinchona calisaya TaxID=153742 RepID=A0ABD2YCW3_9GENT
MGQSYLDSDKNVIFEVDSDSVLTKGLAALLVQGLSGRPVEAENENVNSFLGLKSEGGNGDVKSGHSSEEAGDSLKLNSGGSDGETHFNVNVVSEEFKGKSLVKRHRLIYGLLQDELQSGLHALSIVANTPSEVNSSRVT